jgi:VanZ family protein
VGVRSLRFAHQWIAVGWLLVAGLVAASLLTAPGEAVVLRYADKPAHVVAYLLVMAWFVQIWRSRRVLFAYACFLVLLGVALELLQATTGQRTADAFDAMANSGGVLLGWLTARTPASGLLERLDARLGPLR